jgi:hypothetical protein
MRAQAVQACRKNLLASARLAEEQDCRIRSRDVFDLSEDRLKGGTASHDLARIRPRPVTAN